LLTADAWRRFFCVALAAKKNGAKRMLQAGIFFILADICHFSPIV